MAVQANLLSNFSSLVEEMGFTLDGKSVRVVDLNGKVTVHPISALRRASDTEILKLHKMPEMKDIVKKLEKFDLIMV